MFTRHPIIYGTALLLLIALILTLTGNTNAGRYVLALTVLFVPISLAWNLWLDRRSKRR